MKCLFEGGTDITKNEVHRLNRIKKKIRGWRKQGYNVDELDQMVESVEQQKNIKNSNIEGRLQKKEIRSKSKIILTIVLLAIIVIIVTIAFFVLKTNFPTNNPIAVGDCVDVQYIGKFQANGTVFISTGGTPEKIFVNPDMNLLLPSGYETYTSTPIFVPREAIRRLIGMKEGETKNITLSPEEAYSDWNTSLADQYGFGTYPVNEIWDVNVENISTEEFSYYFSDVEIKEGTLFDYWATAFGLEGILNAKITKVADGNVTFKMLPINGTTFAFPPFNWTATILVTNDTAFTIHSNISLNYTFIYQDPTTEKKMIGKVINVDESEATIGLNAIAPSIEFVGQTLMFEFKVVSITKTSQK